MSTTITKITTGNAQPPTRSIPLNHQGRIHTIHDFREEGEPLSDQLKKIEQTLASTASQLQQIGAGIGVAESRQQSLNERVQHVSGEVDETKASVQNAKSIAFNALITTGGSLIKLSMMPTHAPMSHSYIQSAGATASSQEPVFVCGLSPNDHHPDGSATIGDILEHCGNGEHGKAFRDAMDSKQIREFLQEYGDLVLRDQGWQDTDSQLNGSSRCQSGGESQGASAGDNGNRYDP